MFNLVMVLKMILMVLVFVLFSTLKSLGLGFSLGLVLDSVVLNTTLIIADEIKKGDTCRSPPACDRLHQLTEKEETC